MGFFGSDSKSRAESKQSWTQRTQGAQDQGIITGKGSRLAQDEAAILGKNAYQLRGNAADNRVTLGNNAQLHESHYLSDHGAIEDAFDFARTAYDRSTDTVAKALASIEGSARDNQKTLKAAFDENQISIRSAFAEAAGGMGINQQMLIIGGLALITLFAIKN